MKKVKNLNLLLMTLPLDMPLHILGKIVILNEIGLMR